MKDFPDRLLGRSGLCECSPLSPSGDSSPTAGDRHAGSLRRVFRSFTNDRDAAALSLSRGSDEPGGRGDRPSLRSRLLIRCTSAARLQKSVKNGIENEIETPAFVSTQ